LGLGRGDRAFRWQAVGQVATLAMVITLARAHASLITLTAAAVATPLLASIANTYSVWRDPALVAASPMAGPERAAIARRIRDEGVLFFVLQLAAALAFSADLPLIATFQGPAEAGTYALVQRLFSVIPLSLSLIWAPLWPIYRQALAAHDHQWVMRTLRRSLMSAIGLAAACSAILAFGFDRIIVLWVHGPLLVGGLLLGGFATWCVIEAAGTAMATFLNAASVMRFQVITASAFAVTCFAGKAWIIATLGISWIPWITVLTYCLTSVLPFIWFGRRVVSTVFTRRY
jgi:O-antigen/teichoic acid export membrane protein